MIVASTSFNLEPQKQNVQSGRSPASVAETTMIDLSTGWKFYKQAEALELEEIQRQTQWTTYDSKNKIDYYDTLVGEYWLKKEFRVNERFQYPAIVLGLIGTSHQAYLNNHYIGGSSYFSYTATYTFDHKILKETNTLYLKVYTAKGARPGIAIIKSLGAKLGEYPVIQRQVLENIVGFHFLRNTFLVVSFILFLLCFTYWSFHTHRMEYIYFSFFLLLGSTALLYYNFFVSHALPYQFCYFIKIFSITLSSCVLLSSFLSLNRLSRLETFNNIFIFIFGTTLALCLLPQNLPAADFFSRYNNLFNTAVAYGCIWIVGAFVWSGMKFFEVRGNLHYVQKPKFGLISLILLSGVLNLVIIYSSIKGGHDWLSVSQDTRSLMNYIGITYPFVFSFLLLAYMLKEHISNTHKVDYEDEKNELNMMVIKVLNQCDNLDRCIPLIQETFCKFIGCERSTIYVTERADKNEFLAAHFKFGEKANVEWVRNKIDTDRGIIGAVFHSKKAIYIKDINNDEMYSIYFRGKKDVKSYKTKSCMVFPLMLQNNMIGILTVADKIDGTPFKKKDFVIMQHACRDIAFIIRNAQLQMKLKEQLDGIIIALSRMIGRNDPYTEFHSEGVRFVTKMIATEIGFPVSYDIKIAALLHDVGKVFVPPGVLNKPGRLNEREREIIEKHSLWSQEVLANIPGFEDISKWTGLHHETLDGKGYPYNLKGELIPIEAQIISVADFIDATSTHRPYREKMSVDKVSGLLESMAEKNKFSKKLSEAGIKVIHDDKFSRYYAKRSQSYRPSGPTTNVVIQYYSDLFDNLRTSVLEVANLVETEQLTVPQEKADQLLTQLKHLNIAVSKLSENLDPEKAA